MVAALDTSSASMTDSLLEAIAEDLRAYPHLSSIVVTETPWGAAIRLPPADGADYRFVFSREHTGDHHIRVELLNGAAGPADSDLWRLYQTFELEEFDQSPAQLAAAFRSDVEELVHARTRIRQQRGWLVWRLYLEREAAPDNWTLVYSCAFMRWRHIATPDGAFRTYHAPPVAPGRPFPPSA